MQNFSPILSENITEETNRRLLDIELLTLPGTTEKVIKEWNKRKIAVKGFRPGKVPKPVVEKYVGAEKLYQSEMVQIYNKIKAEKGFISITDPDLTEWHEEPNGSLKFRVKVDILKEFEIEENDYLGIEVPKDETDDAVAEKAYESYLNSISEQFGVFKPVERATSTGDYVTVTSKGTLEGKPCEELTFQSRTLSLDERVLGKELVETFVSAQKDVSTSATITFSEKVPTPTWKDKTATLEFTVEEVKELVPHPIDDSLAKQSQMGVETLPELKEKCIEEHKKTQLELIEKKFEFACMETLLKKINLTIPETMINNEIASIIRYRIGMFQSVGLSKDQAIENLDFDLVGSQARNRVSAAIIFDKLFRKEVFKLDDVSADDVALKISQKVEEYDTKEEELKEKYSSPEELMNLKKEILYERFVRKIVDNAKAIPKVVTENTETPT